MRLSRSSLARMAAVAALAATLATPARANDRPYLLTNNAAAEEDDYAVWSIETWWQRAGAERGFTLAPEYDFDPTNSLELEFTAARGGGRAFELDAKHLFNHIARDGWGWGVDLSWTVARNEAGAWRSEGLMLKLPVSVSLRDGDALLHANIGVQKTSDERREWVGSLAFEHRLPWRTSAFVEVGREDHRTLLHAGVRHWIRRERLAFDLAVQQWRGAEQRNSGIVIGLAWYDL
jgi:hypothetical protein